MKKIFKPAEKEEALYYTDFKGYSCGEYGPDVEVKINFNYGSQYDGDSINLHLNDEEVKVFLELIKKNISEDYKNSLRDKLKKTEKDYEDSMQWRDWDSCDREIHSLHLLRYMLDLKEDEEQ